MPPIGQGKRESEDRGIRAGQAPPEHERTQARGGSPLGRGADPGSVSEHALPTASGSGGPSGLHGHSVPRAPRGPAGLVNRENEDETQESRTDEAYPP